MSTKPCCSKAAVKPACHTHDHHYASIGDLDVAEDVQKFLETQKLEKPLTFAKTDAFDKYTRCGAWAVALLSYGIGCIAPVPLFCPRRVTQHYSLTLDQDTLTFHSAVNDCCMHIARSTKTMPLDKIQDVQLKEGCCETLFGLKTINIQTAGMNGPNGAPEVVARFLVDPEQAREAIQLAVKLTRARALTAPCQMSMGAPSEQQAWPTRVPVPSDQPGSMQLRLERLGLLRELGVLTAKEVDSVRAKVLAAGKDYTAALFEAHELLSKDLVSEKDYRSIRDELLAQVQGRA